MNILVLTSIYRDPEDSKDAETTPVVHNFAREWVKQGHRVVVVHNFNIFMAPLYYIPKKILDFISNRVGFRCSLNIKQRKQIEYNNEGVIVHRIPIMKLIPKGAYFECQLKKQLAKIEIILKNNSFIPDVIVAHSENPQIYLLYWLKKKYSSAITCIIFHGLEYLDRSSFHLWRDKYLPNIDKYGFRSKRIYQLVCNKIAFDKDFFLCPSGISDIYILPKLTKNISSVKKILFVGQLIARKHVKTIIDAVSRRLDRNYEITIIGAGAQDEELKEMSSALRVNATFLGKLPHETVITEMKKADCFIMVSEREVFGLVYLEAMSQGCITVASEKEGMDGIITHQKNGFLCKAGDTESLLGVLDYIENLSSIELNLIRQEALSLAKQYSSYNVAERYLQNVIA